MENKTYTEEELHIIEKGENKTVGWETKGRSGWEMTLPNTTPLPNIHFEHSTPITDATTTRPRCNTPSREGKETVNNPIVHSSIRRICDSLG